MMFTTPVAGGRLAGRLAELDGLRNELCVRIGGGGPWLGSLRRLVKASSAESSVSIEGYSVPEDKAVAIVSGPRRAEAADENELALADYARAMDHVSVMADDPVFEWSDRVILDLHFDACWFQRAQMPGRWRETPIVVTGAEGGVAYRAPDADLVVSLMGEVVEWLGTGDREAHVVVRAAMAHLHTVSVHPFRDGNGRISRIVQSLVLAREGLLSPEFASIEEHLGRYTPEYYAVLRRVQGGEYQPQRDASEWVQFCVDAHIEQARRRLDQLTEAAARWAFLEDLVERRRWPDRLVIALEQSLIGGTDRSMYEAEADISPATASNDFRRLVDAELIERAGRGRSTRYHAGVALRNDVRLRER
ncbi:MAG: Fic family protein [Actinobacteria bacterium]|nr:Fic family protein [Actinomycetota bacterium]